MSRQRVPSKRLFVDDEDDAHSRPAPAAKKVQSGFFEYQLQVDGNLVPSLQDARDGSASQPASSGSASSAPAATRKQISCGECRRLKLKCDRVFPCKACVKRGCADICPDGSLVSGKGSRYVLASTERLHEKISALVERVRELENALETLHDEHRNCSEQSRTSPLSQHPLLSQEKRFIKSTMDLHTEGTLGRPPLVRKDRQRKAQMQAAGSQSTDTPNLVPANGVTNGSSSSPPLDPSLDSSSASYSLSSSNLNGHSSITALQEPDPNLVTGIVTAAFFPVLSAAFVPAHERKSQLQSHEEETLQCNFYSFLQRELPIREEAESLLSIIETTGTFVLSHMLTHRDFTLILDSCYARPDPRRGTLNLALLFITCAIGYQVGDISADEERDVIEAKRCFSLSRTALVKFAFDLASAPQSHNDLLGITKCLYLFESYLTFFSWQKEDELEASRVVDVLQVAVQRLDLNSDHAHEFYDAATANERRLLCYAIMTVVGKFSLTSGKSIPGMPRVASRPPSCVNDIDRFPNGLEASYHQACDKFLATCVVPMFEKLASPSTRYEAILELDCTVRDFPFPSELSQEFGLMQDPFASSVEARGSVNQELLRFCTVTYIHTTLLQLHRPFFQSSLKQCASVLDTPHAISVFATMRSACIILRAFDAMEKAFPRLMTKVTISWYFAFCAASVLYITVERIPYCPLSPFSIRELNRAVQIFSRSRSPFARHTLPMIRQLASRSAERLSRWQIILVEELSTKHAGHNKCQQRFQAIHERAEAAREAFDRRVPSQGRLGLSRATSSAAISSIRAQNPVFNPDVYKGLECWDYAHPDVLDIVITLPACSMEEKDNDELAQADILSPTNRVLDLPPHNDARRLEPLQCNTGMSLTPSSDTDSAGSGRLAEFFDRLDASLYRRTTLETPSSRARSRSPPQFPPALPTASGWQNGTLDLDELLKNDVDIDWAALTDVLISAPQLFGQLDSTNQSAATETYDTWRLP